MPCHEYQGKRFWVEMDRRDYDRLISVCRDVFGDSLTDIAPTVSRIRGECIAAVALIAEKALEILGDSGLTLDALFEKQLKLEVMG